MIFQDSDARAAPTARLSAGRTAARGPRARSSPGRSDPGPSRPLDARDCDAPALEGYPVEAAGARIDSTFGYVGTAAIFEAAGFRRIAPASARRAGLPRVVMRHGLTG
jgi:hypothetical protein